MPHLYLALMQGLAPSEFREDIHETRMNELPLSEGNVMIR